MNRTIWINQQHRAHSLNTITNLCCLWMMKTTFDCDLRICISNNRKIYFRLCGIFFCGIKRKRTYACQIDCKNKLFKKRFVCRTSVPEKMREYIFEGSQDKKTTIIQDYTTYILCFINIFNPTLKERKENSNVEKR